MAEHTFEQAHRSLNQGEIHPVYLLVGTEEILKDELIETIVDRVLDPSARDFNLDVRGASDLTGESLHALIETPPMLAAQRAVVIRGIDQWRKNAKIWTVLEQYLSSPSSSTTLIMTYRPAERDDKRKPPPGNLAGAAYTVAVDALKPAQVTRWIGARAKKVGVQLDADATDHLASATNGDLAHIAQELEKLAVALPDDHIATAEDVAEFVGVRRGETVHDWVDRVLARDTVGAVGLIDVVLTQPGVTGVQLVMTLGGALVGVRVARALLDAGTSSARLETAVFQKVRAARPARLRKWGIESKFWTQSARSWSAAELDDAIALAYATDKLLKSSTVSDTGGILRSLVLQLDHKAAA